MVWSRKMAQIKLHDQRKPLELWKLMGRCTVSFISVLLSQLALSLVPRFFSASPLIIQLILSALVLLVVVGLGRCSKRLLGVSGSASAFVFFNILFIWAVYLAVLRPAVSCLMDIAFNGAITMLIIGLCSIMSSNPGLVTYGSSDEFVESSVAEVEAHNWILEPSASVLCHECPTEGSVLGRRVRYCRICKGYIKGFDHHCPAFGNCIGQNNHVLFMVLLVGFLSTEASYIVCSSQFAAKSQIADRTRLETSLSGNLAISTMLFSIFQLPWQAVFMMWHIYCICFNIRTDEWINWKKYPEFQDDVHSQPASVLKCSCASTKKMLSDNPSQNTSSSPIGLYFISQVQQIVIVCPGLPSWNLHHQSFSSFLTSQLYYGACNFLIILLKKKKKR